MKCGGTYRTVQRAFSSLPSRNESFGASPGTRVPRRMTATIHARTFHRLVGITGQAVVLIPCSNGLGELYLRVMTAPLVHPTNHGKTLRKDIPGSAGEFPCDAGRLLPSRETGSLHHEDTGSSVIYVVRVQVL